jgi:hypothetical protein
MAMQITRRPWILASSVALVGAGMIAVNPPAPSRPDVHVRPVTLTAVDDPLTALDDVLQAASANATALNDEFAAAPLPALQQFVANLIGFADNYPGDAATIATEIADHLQNLTSLLDPSASGFLYNALADSSDYQVLYQYAESPLSGVALGEAETVLNPLLALNDSYQDIVSDLGGATPDTTAAFNDVLDIPANILDALLNGQFLDGTVPEIDLSSLVTALGVAPYYSVSGPVLQLGGLLSPGGGSFLDALSYEGGYFPPCTPPECFGEEFVAPGNQIGLFGALETLSQDVATALGWSGTGNPLDVVSDLPSAAGSLATEFNTLTTDFLATLAGTL